ncbi:MAG: GTPase HflX [Bifidobacteriaceae bacterium]|jgi:GTP-binding protein HflX|nr:GTPase HflX [Bifidobacteriaceae bacterium]
MSRPRRTGPPSNHPGSVDDAAALASADPQVDAATSAAAADAAEAGAAGVGRKAAAGSTPEARWEELEKLERAALRRRPSLATELQDITEVEYRQLRLEKVVLVGLFGGGQTRRAAELSLEELAALAQTAGSEVLDQVLQQRIAPDPALYLGRGKAEELAGLVRELGADTVIVDSELAPSQRRALEDVVGAKVVDRTTVILDIFASHAKSKEGKAQVELAQLEYLLPRLRGWGESMSRQAGGRVAGGAGIGSRGPGEAKIELDRRRIRSRISKLKRELVELAPQREGRRAQRRRASIASVSLVGYTNAGKSSLMRALTGADVLVDDQLFATLDPTVRALKAADGRAYTLSDTVGFVRRLPHQLIEAFASTLEESAHADLLVHVVDSTAADVPGQIEAVRSVLSELGGEDGWGPELVVFAKADAAPPGVLDGLLTAYPGSLAVSAVTGEGLEELRRGIEQALPRPPVEVDVLVPFARGDLVARAHRTGEVLAETYEAGGTRLTALVGPALAAELHAVAGANPV